MISRWMPASTSFASARVRPKSARSTRPSGRLISTTSAHRPSPSAPISTSLKTQATHPPSVRERARKYPTAVAPPISRRSPSTTVVEVPVEEQVKLRAETVVIERRPTTGTTVRGGESFQDRVIEVHEMYEEPVIGKVITQAEEMVIYKTLSE